jgi:uncharacterized membrane protein (DUF2068 family)
VLQAILLLVAGLALLAVRAAMPRMVLHFPRLFGGLLPVIGGVLIIVALLNVLFAWGLWNGKGWAWILALIFAVLGILFSLVSLVRGGLGSIIVLIIDVVIVYYLTRPNVKAFFSEAKTPSSTPTPTPTMMAQPPTASTSNKVCSNCGAPLTSDEKFCAHCGAKLP